MSPSSVLRTDHAIVYTTKTPLNRKSAVTFVGAFALVPASVLIGSLSAKIGKRLARWMITGKFVDVLVSEQHDWPELRSLELRIVHRIGRDIRTSEARVRYVFNCMNIFDSVNSLLDGLQPAITDDANVGPDVGYGLEQCSLSAFVVLHFGESIAASVPSLLESHADTVRKVVNFWPIRRLDRIAAVTTPFTNEIFFKSINLGSVSNVFGTDDCLFVVSPALVAGCNGGAIFNERLELSGIIICTTFRWKGVENASMTLAASFAEIVNAFLIQSSFCKGLRVERNVLGSHCQMEKCVVLIEVGVTTGSGCFMRINSLRFILTCAHVVANAKTFDSTIVCTWIGGTFRTRPIYRNAQYAHAYDIALLHVPDSAAVPEEMFASCAPNPPRVGQRVYATGFPHFYALARVQFAPSLLEGHVSKVSEHVLFTDASIQAGQSGGPMLDDGGNVLGVMVCNARDSIDGRIYPQVNMSIPIGAVSGIIGDYADSGDISVLDRLRASDGINRIWNLRSDAVMSKL